MREGGRRAVLGTLKGAIATTWQDLCTCQEGQAGDAGWGKIPAPDDLEKRLGELGITKDKEIIVFADTVDGWGMMPASCGNFWQQALRTSK